MEAGKATQFFQSYPMKGGEGLYSYVQNSYYQKGTVDAAKKLINDAISKKFDLQNPYFSLTPNTIKIADFGCSVGPNTFLSIQNILEAVELKYHKENLKIPEFHIFFNDHTDNDFNTLFKNLPVVAKYYAAAAPGSFHGRVFPNQTLHLGHTSSTLHWLSKLPEEILNPDSPAFNKGSIHCDGLVKEVFEAYLNAFKSDMTRFLRAREQELVPGGLMFLMGSCLPDGMVYSQTWKGMVLDFIGCCLMDMAKSGLISKEKVETFNMPVYIPHISELKEVIGENSCFSIEIMDQLDHPMKDETQTLNFRPILEGMIDEHFGQGFSDDLFNYFEEKLAKTPIDFEECRKDMQFFIVVRRK